MQPRDVLLKQSGVCLLHHRFAQTTPTEFATNHQMMNQSSAAIVPTEDEAEDVIGSMNEEIRVRIPHEKL